MYNFFTTVTDKQTPKHNHTAKCTKTLYEYQKRLTISKCMQTNSQPVSCVFVSPSEKRERFCGIH